MKPKEVGISQSHLKYLFNYDPLTGLLTWRVKGALHTKIGSKAGGSGNKALERVTINRRKYVVSRIIWIYMTGNDPKEYVSYVDNDSKNLKWTNLRLGTELEIHKHKVLSKTNKTGFKGITKVKNRYRAEIGIDKERLYIGSFKTKEEAAKAYNQYAEVFNKDFYTLNKLS